MKEKKRDNRCDGSCAGIQYFNCLPGYGVFTTIERIVPHHIPSNIESIATDLDVQIHKNALCINSLDKNPDRVKYGGKLDYNIDRQEPSNSYQKNTNFKTSLSLHTLTDGSSINTNNDFDQNTILQPDNTQLLNEKSKVSDRKSISKTNIDLIDVIGGVWAGTTESDKLPGYAGLKKTLEKSEYCNTTDRNTGSKFSRNRSPNLIVQLSSKTLPKKTKFMQDIRNSKENLSPASRSEFYVGKLFLNMYLM